MSHLSNRFEKCLVLLSSSREYRLYSLYKFDAVMAARDYRSQGDVSHIIGVI